MTVEVAASHLAFLLLFLIVQNMVHFVVDHVVTEHVTLRTDELHGLAIDLCNAAISIISLVLRREIRLLTHFVMGRNRACLAGRVRPCVRKLDLLLTSYNFEVKCRIFLFFTVSAKLRALVYALNSFFN